MYYIGWQTQKAFLDDYIITLEPQKYREYEAVEEHYESTQRGELIIVQFQINTGYGEKATHETCGEIEIYLG